MRKGRDGGKKKIYFINICLYYVTLGYIHPNDHNLFVINARQDFPALLCWMGVGWMRKAENNDELIQL